MISLPVVNEKLTTSRIAKFGVLLLVVEKPVGHLQTTKRPLGRQSRWAQEKHGRPAPQPRRARAGRSPMGAWSRHACPALCRPVLTASAASSNLPGACIWEKAWVGDAGWTSKQSRRRAEKLRTLQRQRTRGRHGGLPTPQPPDPTQRCLSTCICCRLHARIGTQRARMRSTRRSANSATRGCHTYATHPTVPSPRSGTTGCTTRSAARNAQRRLAALHAFSAARAAPNLPTLPSCLQAADIFFIPTLTAPKDSQGGIGRGCGSCGASELLRHLPHLRAATAARHVLLCPLEHFAMSACEGWWSHPQGLLAEALRRSSYAGTSPTAVALGTARPIGDAPLLLGNRPAGDAAAHLVHAPSKRAGGTHCAGDVPAPILAAAAEHRALAATGATLHTLRRATVPDVVRGQPEGRRGGEAARR